MPSSRAPEATSLATVAFLACAGAPQATSLAPVAAFCFFGAGHGPLEGLACAGAPQATSLATVAAFCLFGAGHGPLEGRCRAGFFTSALENAVRLARQELANEQFDDVFTVTGR